MQEQSMQRAIEWKLGPWPERPRRTSGQLDMLSPLKVLGRGYPLAQRPSGQLVTQAQAVEPCDRLRTPLC
jgi:exonuclease VII large subunit